MTDLLMFIGVWTILSILAVIALLAHEARCARRDRTAQHFPDWVTAPDRRLHLVVDGEPVLTTTEHFVKERP